MSNRKIFSIFVIMVAFACLFLLFLPKYRHKDTAVMIMGGKLYLQACEGGDTTKRRENVEKYVRPSDMPVLNGRMVRDLYDEFYGKKVSEIRLPDRMFVTPEDTVLNYFSILREAANHEKGKGAGCGTIGRSTIPYPIAYHFLSSSYQAALSYEQYLETFQNILHISLIKYRRIPVFDNPHNIIRYFVEIETIEGNEKYLGDFVYYYGFADLKKENKQYKIANLEFHGENYLCAPMHGWAYDAELSVKIRYGGWCDLIKEMDPVIQKEYIKNVSFQGTDGNDYLIVFYQLTNDTDIEIAQYIKSMDGGWKLIEFNPEDCLDDGSG